MSATDFFASEETNHGIMGGSIHSYLIEIIERNKPLPDDFGEAGVLFEEMDNLLHFMTAAFEGMSAGDRSYAECKEQVFAGAASIMEAITLLNRRLAQFNRARLIDRVEGKTWTPTSSPRSAKSPKA